MATDKQIAANRENAKRSTGPVSSEGKTASSHNAVKTGLTGQTVLLKSDDVEAYSRHVQRFAEKFNPASEDERTLVQDLADTEWRLLRITPLEAGILALGRLQLAPLFAAETDLAIRESLLEAKVYLTYQRDLRNLTLQQNRLRRHRASVIAELAALQDQRIKKSISQAKCAARYYFDAINENWPFDLRDFGFEFTLEQMFEQAAAKRATDERDLYPEVTKKVYLREIRAQYAEHFGEE